jgi:phosphoserine phosphatase RsbU/P
MSPYIVWSILLLAAVLAGAAILAVRQRNKARRLLAEERHRSGGLLRRFEADLERAARIQQNLLPKVAPRLAGFDIDGLNVPCYEVGGDYYDIIPIDEDRLSVVIADVSGKGISASLLMASLRAALRGEVWPDHDPARLAARLNDFVYTSSGPSNFVTFFFGELDRRTAAMRYVNAGHNPPFVLDRDGKTRALDASGLPLGMFAGSTYETRTIDLEPGAMAVLFTDGIPEGRNGRGEDYTVERLERVVRDSRSLRSADICRKVIDDMRGYVCGTQPCDDVTLVVVKRNSV